MSGAYVLGTAATYTIAGVIAGASGEQLQAYFQNPWALGIFAALFAALALSMFGFYELQMPSFIQSHLHSQSQHMQGRFKHVKGGALFGLFGMGMLSALVIGACVSPLLISALGVAIANRDPVLGGAIMFSMALGMGVILIAIGVGAGFLLPKAGPWMNRVKHVFGVLLIAVAIYLLGLIPEVPVLLLWAALLIIVGIYLGATQSLAHGASGWQYLWKGVGTVSLIWGVAAMLGGFVGNRDVLSPLPLNLSGGVSVSGGATAATEAHLFQRVASLDELDRKLAEAKRAGKPVLLDYFATWCTDCVRMEKATFNQARVQEEMKRFVLLQADVTDPNDPQTKAIKARYGVFGPPAMLLFDKDGSERRELRTYGFKGPDDFVALLRKI
jgi:thiol:disulfide interchange protein DsbD